MSNEGREQFLCKKGHETIFDCWDAPDRDDFKCYHCGSDCVWWKSIDDTNGHGRATKLEVDVPQIVCEYDKCGNKHVTEPTRYKIPEQKK